MSKIVLIFLGLMLAGPLMAIAFNCIFNTRPTFAAKLASSSVGVGLLSGGSLLYYLSANKCSSAYSLIDINTLNVLLCVLVLLVSFIVHRFSLRYMHGDRIYTRFFILLSTLTLSALIMVLADNLFLFWCGWSFSNAVLVVLMIHKKEWVAAKNSGMLALYTFISGSICLLIAFLILSITYSTSSILALTQIVNIKNMSLLIVAEVLITICAVTQSGLFPFNRWLLSSLNSPTPISALMHAGIVNGGGILIVKFALLMMICPQLLLLLFITGFVSALLGTVWKLMQHDVKKMLACSTMAQMGFMMMQCGVGLFAAAIAHLCWHGLFKAYLFLSSGSAIKQQKEDGVYLKASPIMLIISLVGGMLAMSSFAFATNKSFNLLDANSFVLFFAFIAGAQLVLTMFKTRRTIINLLLSLVFALFSGLMYGASIQIIQWLIPSISAIQAPQISLIHWLVMGLFGALWLGFNLGVYKKIGQSKLGCWLYMNLFNLSQPSKRTITTIRNDYNY